MRDTTLWQCPSLPAPLENRNPPAKPGVLHRRAKPYDGSARVTSRWYGLASAKVCYLLPVNGFLQMFPIVSCSPALSSSN